MVGLTYLFSKGEGQKYVKINWEFCSVKQKNNKKTHNQLTFAFAID